jgi:hypothetical protein
MKRDGFYAGWRGVEYEAAPDGERVRLYSPVPIDGFTEAFPGRFVRVVVQPEVDHLVYLRTRCEWRGEPFQVLAETPDWVRLEYLGGTPPADFEMESFDRDVLQVWVPRGELTEVREERI